MTAHIRPIGKVIGALARGLRCEKGVAATEFALIAPILIFFLLGVADMSKVIYDRMDMHASLRNGAQYFMAGGTDLEAARGVIQQSWSSALQSSTVEVESYCLCGETPATCSVLCPDDSVPDIYRELSAATLLQGIFGEYAIEVNETVRAR